MQFLELLVCLALSLFFHFAADAPGQFPDLFGYSALFVAAAADEADQFLHAYAHYHIFVVEGVLCGGGRVAEVGAQPFF